MPRIHLISPSASDVRDELRKGTLNMNHFSTIVRLYMPETPFGMVIAADAQMGNWHFYDQQATGRFQCSVYRAAHHGSKRGSQFERLDRFQPSHVIVSADAQNRRHSLPDEVGGAAFESYASSGGSPSRRPVVALTEPKEPFGGAGTVEVRIAASGHYEMYAYGDAKDEIVDLGKTHMLSEADTADWGALVRLRLSAGGGA